MRKLIYTFLIFALCQTAFSQTYQSSCDASQGVKDYYRTDAQRLALKRILRQNLTYKDSVKISQTHVDTILRALIAVHNLDIVPAVDTVVNLLKIHDFPSFNLREFQVLASKSYPWIQKLKLNQIPTGDSYIDNLISTYQLTRVSFYSSSSSWDMVVFRTAENVNLNPIMKAFLDYPSTHVAREAVAGSGATIVDSVYSDHVELTYSYGWGDCQAGCMYRRYWKFKVYFDCTVDYLGSYGSYPVVMPQTQLDEISNASMNAYPNPFSDLLTLGGVDSPFEYSIQNAMGQTISEGHSDDGQIKDLGQLTPGVYILNIQIDGTIHVIKLIHQ